MMRTQWDAQAVHDLHTLGGQVVALTAEPCSVMMDIQRDVAEAKRLLDKAAAAAKRAHPLVSDMAAAHWSYAAAVSGEVQPAHALAEVQRGKRHTPTVSGSDVGGCAASVLPVMTYQQLMAMTGRHHD